VEVVAVGETHVTCPIAASFDRATRPNERRAR
jgi:hypothetical protein